MVVVAGVAVVLAVSISVVRCNQNPRIKVTIFNETSAALCDVRIKFMNGDRTAERIEPGGSGVTQIQSAGDAGVFLSYHASNGTVRTDEAIYYSLDDGGFDSGFLEVHVDNSGTRLVKAIHKPFVLDIPLWTTPINATGRIMVK